MILGTDESGKVWLIGNGDISTMPTEWNGMMIKAHALTGEQAVLYTALPSDRSAVVFDGEAFAVLPVVVDPKEVIRAQLAAIDAATGSVRWIRELALGMNDMIIALQAGPLPNLPSAGTGMAKVQAIEDQCAVLRNQLAALG